jgi:transposase
MFVMSYGYSLDLRSKVLCYLDGGHTQKQACQVFGISNKTIYNWISLKKETGSLALRRSNPYKPSKFEEQKLKDYVVSHSDAYLDEIAGVFKGSASGVYRALKRFKITRKKSRSSIKNVMKLNDRSSVRP